MRPLLRFEDVVGGEIVDLDAAERMLLKTALTEMSTLDGSLRKVVKSKSGYDAHFLGMPREKADLACRRLQARQVTCFMVGPG